MAERYAISQVEVPEGAAVPELVKLKMETEAKLAEAKKQALAEKQKTRDEERAKLKERTAAYEKEYADTAAELVKLRREAKLNGNFFVEPEAKLLFVVRIAGIIKMSPKPRKVLQLLRLKQLHNGVFLKVNKPILNMLKLVQPYVTYGFPSLKTVRELIYKRGFGKVSKQRIPLSSNDIISDSLGKLHGLHGLHQDQGTASTEWRTSSMRSTPWAQTSSRSRTSYGPSSSPPPRAASSTSVTASAKPGVATGAIVRSLSTTCCVA
ncbi:unnamed protein product [Cladocopium goreaui]|uniref:60S ribosomal protein L7-4 n=1 Tax=Cladocopium goreaui TaxID=2562237 RepID=A0A9P1GI34_9DINO|nr:unnamed protein product [Cladocopium goreaui]